MMMLLFVLLVYTEMFTLLIAADEIQLAKLEPSEIALMQYDSRNPSGYWLASAVWNNYYCDKHGHKFIYFSTKEGCHYKFETLATPWCKVKAMIDANRLFPEIKLFIYMDSDAVIDRKFVDYPVNHFLGVMQERLAWEPEKKPIVFNQDGPCWWCSLIQKVGYTMCLNAGTVMWYRHPISEMVLDSWWSASMDSYETNPIKRKFRIKWPWEQDRQMAVYNRSSEYIQVASDPDKVMMKNHKGVNDWCLSHLPGSGCFISHYCSNANSKITMSKMHPVPPTYVYNQ